MTPDNTAKIASFDDAIEAVVEKRGYMSEAFYHEAAELYAESKSRDAWSRACEAQKQLCADEIKRKLGNRAISLSSILNAPKPDYQP